jgi:hypothetical protein
MDHFSRLPNDVKRIIFKYITICHIQLRFVCKDWNQLYTTTEQSGPPVWYDKYNIVSKAASIGYYNLMQWAILQNASIHGSVYEELIKNKRFDDLIFVYNNGGFFAHLHATWAVEYSALDILKWMYPNPMTIPYVTKTKIVRHGTIEVKKWYYDNIPKKQHSEISLEPEVWHE